MKPTPLTLRKKLALELWRQQQNIVREEHPLKQLFWECTLRCDLKCRHCGSDCKMKSESNDMPKEGGVGMTNIRKRLSLIYGNDYTLDVNDGENTYEVILDIPLEA